jgi:hypothetical protein
MPTRMVHMVIDAVEPVRLGRFWAAALGWEMTVLSPHSALTPTVCAGSACAGTNSQPSRSCPAAAAAVRTPPWSRPYRSSAIRHIVEQRH